MCGPQATFYSDYERVREKVHRRQLQREVAAERVHQVAHERRVAGKAAGEALKALGYSELRRGWEDRVYNVKQRNDSARAAQAQRALAGREALIVRKEREAAELREELETLGETRPAVASVVRRGVRFLLHLSSLVSHIRGSLPQAGRGGRGRRR